MLQRNIYLPKRTYATIKKRAREHKERKRKKGREWEREQKREREKVCLRCGGREAERTYIKILFSDEIPGGARRHSEVYFQNLYKYTNHNEYTRCICLLACCRPSITPRVCSFRPFNVLLRSLCLLLFFIYILYGCTFKIFNSSSQASTHLSYSSFLLIIILTLPLYIKLYLKTGQVSSLYRRIQFLTRKFKSNSSLCPTS